MRTWTPPLLILATMALVAWKPRPMLKLVAYVAFSTLILASTTAVAGWLAWQAILYLIHQSQT